MSIPSRYSDPQYKSWLKCTLALYGLKKSLHDYTEAGVRRLHSNIKHKVSTLLGSRYQCSACSWKGIHRQRFTGGWSIKCINSICNVWLQEILTKHDDPQTKTINWRNADITKWSTEPWEIAKIYMTKGQWNNANLPKELDSPPLLSLIKYCNEFRPINVQLVSDIIEIRNQVFHSPCMSVSDTDKDTWFDKMLLLLSDLNIEGMVLTEMRKLKTKDIGEYFREQELKAHQNRISEVVNEVETLKDNFESLEDTQSVHEVVIHEQSAYGNLHFGALETELNTQSQHEAEFLSAGEICSIRITPECRDWQLETAFKERKSELETLKTIDMDECSREQESKAHQNWISEVANEVETLKNNFESLENTQRQLGQESQLRDVAQGKSVVSHFQSATIWTPQGQDRQLETEFKERKSKLETYAQVIATMKAFMDNNPDLSSTKISEELKATSEVIMAMQSRLPTAYSSAGTSKFYSVLSEQERKF